MGGGDPVSYVQKKTEEGVNAVTSGISHVGKEIEKGVSHLGKEAEKGVQQVGKNIEKNIGDTLTETAYAVGTGNFNNFDQTLLKFATGGATAGLSLALNPESMQYKETNIQRAAREAQEKAAAQEMEANAAKERERLKGLADMLTASANARRLAPGMSQTLLGSGSTNLLVTNK